jgi:outer membrane protein TolC
LGQAQATLGQAEARLQQTEQEAVREVHTLVADVREARQRAEAQGRAVAQARRGFAIASAEYREGLGSQLQVTDAEVALRQAEFNYAQAVYDFLTAGARLDTAVGTVPAQVSSFLLP